MQINKAAFSIIACLGFAALTPSPASASIIYAITVNTGSEFGQAGYIDIQFNQGDPTSQAATLDLNDFSTDGVLDPAALGTGTVGDVAGSLPGTLAFDNGQTTDEYTEGITFGNAITFSLTFDGPAIESPDGSSASLFLVDFLNSGESAYLFTADPTDSSLSNPYDFTVATISVNPDGSTTPVTYPATVGGTSDATLNQVPEPSMFVLFGSVLACLGLHTVRNRRCR
ncbi:MAG: NF038129 family PEP-CTERM protein [Bryobacteraceae bacterium]